MRIEVRGLKPEIAEGVYLAPTSTVIGEVEIGEESSIWFGVILRGDVNSIRIGKKCNIQDGTIVHGMYQKWDVVLADEVSIGHGVILHGCHVGRRTLVGMGATLMDAVRVGENCIVAAGSLVTQGTEVPDGHLVMGNPAKVVRPLKEKEIELLDYTTNNYVMYKDWFLQDSKILER